jgi:putrescine transport system permease protein
VFIPAVGEYVIPTLLGRTDQLMIGRVLSDEFFENRDWPVASAVATLILLMLVIPIMLFQRSRAARDGECQVRSLGLFARTMLVLGLVFLYLRRSCR